METHSSETLETQNCPDSPKTQNLSPGQVPATTGSSPDFDDLSDWDDEMEKEDLQDDKHLFVVCFSCPCIIWYIEIYLVGLCIL